MKHQRSVVRGQRLGAEQESAAEGQRSGYLTRISVFLITLSGLILEVGLTRIYSASIWYHFAFVAISVALLGWGLGGFTVHLWKQIKAKGGKGKGGKRGSKKQEADGRREAAGGRTQVAGETERTAGETPALPAAKTLSMNAAAVVTLLYAAAIRSEERRIGKECRS